MSNHRFIQVEPPKEELTLPANIVDFSINKEVKTASTISFIFRSPVATFTGLGVGDYIEFSIVDTITAIETFLGKVKIAVFTSVNEIETEILDTTIPSDNFLISNISTFYASDVRKLYKLPTNNFSLQVKTDSIVRYYEDPVDKTIMYIDTLESPSICGNGGPGVCVDIWGHDRASLGIVTLNNTDKIPMHNIVPYLNSIFLGSDDEN